MQKVVPDLRAGFCVLVATVVACAAHAADGTWHGAAGTTNWSDAANWEDGSVADGTDATARFDALDLTEDARVRLDAPVTLGHLVFGDTDPATSALWWIDAVAPAASNTLTLDGNGVSAHCNAGTTVSVYPLVSGAAGLTKTGPGSFHVLNTGNVIDGNVTVAEGTLMTRASLASNAVIAIASGARLTYNIASGELAQRKVRVTGAGTLLKTGAGTAYFGRNTGNRIDWALAEGGLIDVQQGTFYGGGYYNGYWTENQGSLNVEAGATFISIEANVQIPKLTGTGTVQSGYISASSSYQGFSVGLNDASCTFGGTFSDWISSDRGDHYAKIVKVGAGTLRLTGASVSTGTVTVAGGTLKLDGGRLYSVKDGPMSAVSVQSGAALELDDWGASLGQLSRDAGRVVVSNGALRVARASVSGRAATVSAGARATLDTTAGAWWEILDDGPPWSFGAGAGLTLAGTGNGRFAKGFAGTGGIAKTGVGRWTLAGTNTVNGPIDVQEGTLVIAAADPALDAPPPGAALWLDAARGTETNAAGHVTRWLDLSGNGRHAVTTNGPAVDGEISGTRALRFDRSSKNYFECGGLRNMTNMTAFIVYRVASFPSPSEIMALLAEDSTSSNAYGNCVHINVETSKKFIYYIGGATPNAAGNTTLSAGEPVVSEILDDGASWAIYRNGTADGGATRANPWKRLNDFRIGAWNESRWFDGSIGEILVYDRALDGAERDAVYAYLNAKWAGAVPPVPADALLATDAAVSVAAGAAVDFGGQSHTFAELGGNGLVTNGALAVTGSITPGGAGRIGALTFASVTAGGILSVDVDAQTCDRLCAEGDLDLSGLTLVVANPEELRRTVEYVVAGCTGTLIAPFAAVVIPDGWKLKHNAQTVTLLHTGGTIFVIR
jgi:autotransporter-associated beta strand protein